MSAQKPKFNLVQAAEALLENAKKLASSAGGGSGGGGGGGGGAEEEDELRRRIAMTAKKIQMGTAPAIDLLKSDWVVMADVGAWSTLMDWKAFDHIPLDGSISIADLAKAVDAQESLVARLVNMLIAVGKLLPGPQPGHVRHSRVSPFYMSSNPARDITAVAVGNGFKAYARWPEYFARYGRREPPSVTHTPFSFAWGHPELPPWEVKALFPEYAASFARSMKSRQIVGGDMKLVGSEALYDMSWLGEEARRRAAGGDDDSAVVAVDVGGGLGQLLRDIVASVPGIAPGQCVLQDRKEVIEEAAAAATAAGDGVIREARLMEHDFHTEQPVKGAAIYLLRRILLDYPDSLAINILRHLAEALPGTDENPRARILIMEERLLDDGPPVPQNRIVDLVMLSLGGKLRDEKMMTSLATAAGLRVVGFHARPGEPACVVECARGP